MALLVFLAAAAIASTLAEVARARTAEARRRQEEADLAAEMARLLLGGASLSDALPVASDRLAVALGLDEAELRIGREPRDGDVVIDIGAEASLTVPADIDSSQLERLRTRVAPPSRRSSLRRSNATGC